MLKYLHGKVTYLNPAESSDSAGGGDPRGMKPLTEDRLDQGGSCWTNGLSHSG
jgi:hypothetical protein